MHPHCTNVRFCGGISVSSDGGMMLLRQVDRRLGLIQSFASLLPDPRDPTLVTHTQEDLLRQRIFGIAQGYEDLNDHDALRHDLVWQTAIEQDRALASSPTLCRLEQRANRQTPVGMHQLLLEQFIASFKEAPSELILDFDATDDRVHGNQEGRFFQGYYGSYCFLPLYVFCGEQLLVSYLRPSNIDGARHSWAILKLLVGRLREVWPGVKIIFRADSGFCRHRMLRWCDWARVDYVVSSGGRMMMQIVGSFAEFERAMLRERTRNGLDAARKQGRIGGRRPKLTEHQRQEILTLVQTEQKTAADAARLFNVHPATVSRLMQRSNEL
ncbi:MAG: IS1380 family transposase [Verrucomicrobiota bacterium]